MPTRTKFARKGRWSTLEKGWNHSKTLVLQGPANARIRVRYGWGKMAFSSQVQTLDGINPRRLRIGAGFLFFAKAEILVNREIYVSYSVRPGRYP